jgi:hypothetical protein
MTKPFNLPSKYVFIGFILIIVISFVFLGLFLYDNFYLALSEGKTVYISSSDIAFQKINSELFDKIITKINEKINPAPEDWSKIKDPFLYY